VARLVPDRLVVGLGNPGSRYEGTRHNVGFQVADRLASRWGVATWRDELGGLLTEARPRGVAVALSKPQGFMNCSGDSVAALVGWAGLPLDRLLVVHDDLDLPFGVLRVRLRGGAGGHNGIRSIVQSLGTGEFPRLKVGVSRPPEGISGAEYVLSRFLPEEAELLPAIVERAADAAEAVLFEGPVAAMNRFHQT
jgi:PTH1 family peptidyl-tRNA hydrolase